MEQCLFGALRIVNLPINLEKETTHRYRANSFKLSSGAQTRPGSGSGGDERDREDYSAEDPDRKTEAQPGEGQTSSVTSVAPSFRITSI